MKQLLVAGALIVLFSSTSALAQKRPDTSNDRSPAISSPMWEQVSDTLKNRGLASETGFRRAIQVADRQRKDDGRPTEEDYTLSARIRDFVTRARTAEIPVLIPQSAAFADATALATGATYYDFSALYPDGRYVSVLGMCAALNLPNQHPMLEILEKDRQQAPSYKISQSCEAGQVCQSDDLLGFTKELGVLNAR